MTVVSYHPQWQCMRSAFSREEREIAFYMCGQQAFGPLDTLILGMFHGDEAEAGILVSRFLQTCTLDHLEGNRVGVIPVVNPDGVQKKTRANAKGVDLNRNFPTKDWFQNGQDTPFYSGPSAGSEPETRFVVNMLELCPPKKIISVHTPYRVINYDGPGQMLAQTMAMCNGYDVVPDIGYATPGSFGTYAGKERNIPTLTLELPEENFDENAIRSNLNGILAVIRHSV